jgi:hypothetical protein
MATVVSDWTDWLVLICQRSVGGVVLAVAQEVHP